MYIGIEVDRSVHMCYFTISDNIFNDGYTNFCLILRVLCELFFFKSTVDYLHLHFTVSLCVFRNGI